MGSLLKKSVWTSDCWQCQRIYAVSLRLAIADNLIVTSTDLLSPVRYLFDTTVRAGVELRALFIAAMVLLSSGAYSTELYVVDGDTLDVEGVRYRLHGIDAPEAGQKCKKAKGGEWACGKAATKGLEKLVFGHEVRCDSRGVDDYERTIAVCTADGQDINELMVMSGLAWAFRKYSDDYAATEDRARQTGQGIWQAPTQTAWEYRAEKWIVAEQESPDGCPIKGNISKNGQIYHAPWSPWYDKTKIDVSDGERWFCDEAEALKAGWRAPYWGRRNSN